MLRTLLASLRLRFLRGFLWFMPINIRRMVFLLSIAHIVRERAPISDAVLTKLNSIMSLSERDGALRMSLMLSEVVWEGKSTQDVCGPQAAEFKGLLNRQQIDEIITSISDQAPKSLAYAPIGVMRDDVQRLLLIKNTVLQ